MPTGPRYLAVPSILFLCVWALYTWSSTPAIGWLDSPEFVAAAHSLGVAHSPGHPLPSFLGKLMSLFPFGSIAWRINLASSLAAAGATLCLWRCGLIAMQKDNETTALSSSLLSGALSLLIATSTACWSNAIRAEVYALQAFLLMATLLCLLQWQKEKSIKPFLLSCFFMGLALANHHWMALMMFVPATFFFFARRLNRPSLRSCFTGALIGLAGLASLFYLPIRSMTHPEVNFGAPHTLDRFFWTLSGAAFSQNAHTNHNSPFGLDLIQSTLSVFEALTWPVALIAVVSLWHGIASKIHRRTTLLLLAVFCTTCIGRAFLGFDPETPDHHAYLIPAIYSFAIIALLGIHNAIIKLERSTLKDARVLSAAALIIFSLVHGFKQFRLNTMQNSNASNEVAEWEIANLPPRSLLLVGYFQTSFRIWAMHSLQGLRPDVVALDRSFLTYPGHKEEAKGHYPHLDAVLDAPLQAGKPTPLSLLQKLPNPVLMQLHPNLDPPAVKQLLPMGPFALLQQDKRDAASAQDIDLRSSETLNLILSEGAPSEHYALLSTRLWHDTTRLQALCFLGEREWANSIYVQVKALAKDDPMLLSIGQRCGLENIGSTELD